MNLGTSSLLTARYFRTFTRAVAGHARAGHLRRSVRRHSHRRPDRRHDADRRQEPVQVRRDLSVRRSLRQPLRLHVVHGVHDARIHHDVRDHASAAAVAAALHLSAAAAEQQPGGAARARTGLLLAGVLRAAGHHGLRLPELVLSRRRALPVRRRRLDGRAAAVRRVSARYHRDVAPLEERAGPAPRRLQLPDPAAGRRAGFDSGGRASAPLRAALRSVVFAGSARHVSHRLRPHALDAAAQPARRRRQPRAVRAL